MTFWALVSGSAVSFRRTGHVNISTEAGDAMLTWNDVSVIVRAMGSDSASATSCSVASMRERCRGGIPSGWRAIPEAIRAGIESSDREWALLVEDDAWPCDGFADHAIRRLNGQTFVILSLYSGRSALAEDGDEVMRVPPSQPLHVRCTVCSVRHSAACGVFAGNGGGGQPTTQTRSRLFFRDFCVRERLPDPPILMPASAGGQAHSGHGRLAAGIRLHF